MIQGVMKPATLMTSLHSKTRDRACLVPGEIHFHSNMLEQILILHSPSFPPFTLFFLLSLLPFYFLFLLPLYFFFPSSPPLFSSSSFSSCFQVCVYSSNGGAFPFLSVTHSLDQSQAEIRISTGILKPFLMELCIQCHPFNFGS